MDDDARDGDDNDGSCARCIMFITNRASLKPNAHTYTNNFLNAVDKYLNIEYYASSYMKS